MALSPDPDVELQPARALNARAQQPGSEPDSTPVVVDEER
jgi:hypothetical protein